MEHNVTDKPVYTTLDYKTVYTEKCVQVEKAGTTWWMGTGISPAVHPAANVIPMNDFNCANCGFIPPYFSVVAANYALSPVNGDESWAFEFCCDGCQKFNQLASKG